VAPPAWRMLPGRLTVQIPSQCPMEEQSAGNGTCDICRDEPQHHVSYPRKSGAVPYRILARLPICLAAGMEDAMLTIYEVLEFLVEKGPGRTEKQLAEAIYGSGDQAYPQHVNQDCRRLSDARKIERRGIGGTADPFTYYPVGHA
jgi:hypothetical protein